MTHGRHVLNSIRISHVKGIVSGYSDISRHVTGIGGEQGWHSGRALASHQCGPGSIPGVGVICGLSLLVLYSAPRGFSPGTLVFPSHLKPTFNLI